MLFPGLGLLPTFDLSFHEKKKQHLSGKKEGSFGGWNEEQCGKPFLLNKVTHIYRMWSGWNSYSRIKEESFTVNKYLYYCKVRLQRREKQQQLKKLRTKNNTIWATWKKTHYLLPLSPTSYSGILLGAQEEYSTLAQLARTTNWYSVQWSEWRVTNPQEQMNASRTLNFSIQLSNIRITDLEEHE